MVAPLSTMPDIHGHTGSVSSFHNILWMREEQLSSTVGGREDRGIIDSQTTFTQSFWFSIYFWSGPEVSGIASF